MNDRKTQQPTPQSIPLSPREQSVPGTTGRPVQIPVAPGGVPLRKSDDLGQ